MKILIWIKDFILHFIRRLLQIFFGITAKIDMSSYT